MLSIFLAVLCVLYYPAFLLGRHIRRKKSDHRLPDHRHLEVKNYRDEELERVIRYIQQNYTDPDISTIKIQNELGIPSGRIYNLLKDKFHLSFKQLINNIRIDEARRLLGESDLRVTEISYTVGYNDSSYFTKLFKKQTGTSPSEYRDKVKNGETSA